MKKSKEGQARIRCEFGRLSKRCERCCGDKGETSEALVARILD